MTTSFRFFHDDDAQIIYNNLPPFTIDTEITTFKIVETTTIDASKHTTTKTITKLNNNKFPE